MLTKEQAERIKVLMLPLVEYLDSLIAEPQQPGTITAEQAKPIWETVAEIGASAPDEAWGEVVRAGTITAEQPSDAPVAKVRVHRTGGNAGIAWSAVPVNEYDSLPALTDETLLYASHQPPGTTTAEEHRRLVREAVKAAYERGADKCAEIREAMHATGRGGHFVDGYDFGCDDCADAIRALGESNDHG